MAANRLKSLVFVGLAALALYSTGALGQRKPDCSAVARKTSFGEYETVCELLRKWEDTSKLPLWAEIETSKMDIIENCSCNLIIHELTWASLVTHDVNALYLSVEKFVRDEDAKEAEKEADQTSLTVKRSNPMFSADEYGERLYMSDRLEDLLRKRADDELSQDNTGVAIMKNFANIYYDPETFTERYRNLANRENFAMSQSLRKHISTTCLTLLEPMKSTLSYLDKLRRLTKNDRYPFILSSYESNLYKIRITLTMCKFLGENGQLVS